ncbi:MAG: DUF1778 domain-containing protein [Alphaproteobacteria bacterium]
MATSTGTRSDRIELRATAQEKSLLARAAAYERLDLTSFVMRAALPAAEKAVRKAERISLSRRDTRRVLDLLENPPKPTERLLKAARAKHGR